MNNQSQTPATRRQLRERATPTEKDDGKRRAESADRDKDKDTPVASSGVKMRTRLSTGTLVMNGTSTLKEKDIRTPPSTLSSDTSKAVKDASTTGGKRRAAASGNSSETHAMPSKQRRIVRTEGEGSQNDYYCWLCHKESCSVYCQLCPRSYHLKCLMLNSVPKDWVCVECEKSMRAECTDTCSKALAQITTDTLCLLLRYALDRMRQPGSEVFQKPVDSADIPMYSDFVIHPMDFTTLEKNIKKKEYGCTEAFLADAKWILHNCIIFNGVHHKLTAVARNVVKSCKHEMTEIEVCPQCYQHSCVGDDNWFIEPCEPPHTLVWAKLKGYPFWPAKALQELNGQVDVRFFGAHDMSWIPLSQVFLLSKETPTTMKNKKGGFASAISEMEEHIKIIKKKYGSFDYAPYRTPYDRRHVYMNNKLKCVNMMAAKRFKTAAFGKLAVRMKEAEKVSAATKTASALKSKYTFMASKKSAAVTGQGHGQGRQHQLPPASSSSDSSPETAEKSAWKAASSSGKTPMSRSQFWNPTVSVTDIIQGKIQMQQELDDEGQAGRDQAGRGETADQTRRDAAEKDASGKGSSQKAAEKCEEAETVAGKREGPEEVAGKRDGPEKAAGKKCEGAEKLGGRSGGESVVEEGKKRSGGRAEKEERKINAKRKEGGKTAAPARKSQGEADAEGELSSDSAELLMVDESCCVAEDPAVEKTSLGRERSAAHRAEQAGVETVTEAAAMLKGGDASAPAITDTVRTESRVDKKVVNPRKTGVGVEEVAAGAQKSARGAEKAPTGEDKPEGGGGKQTTTTPGGEKASWSSDATLSEGQTPSAGSGAWEEKAVAPKVPDSAEGSKMPSSEKGGWHLVGAPSAPALLTNPCPEYVTQREKSPKSGAEYKDALMKTIEACKGKLGIVDIEEIGEPRDVSDDDTVSDDQDIKGNQDGPKANQDRPKDSQTVGSKAADVAKAGEDKVRTPAVPKAGHGKCAGDKVNLPKETLSYPVVSSESMGGRQGGAGDSSIPVGKVVTAPPGSSSLKTEAEPSAKDKLGAAPTAKDKVEASPAAKDKVEATPTAKGKVETTPIAKDKVEAPPTAKDKVEATPSAMDKMEASPTAKDKVEAVPSTKDKVEAAPTAKDKVEAAPSTKHKVEAVPTAKDKVEAAPSTKDKMAAECVEEALTKAPGKKVKTSSASSTSYTSIKSIPGGKSSEQGGAKLAPVSSKLVFELTKPLAKSPTPVSERAVLVSASSRPVSKSSGPVLSVGKDTSGQAVSGTGSGAPVVMVMNKHPVTKVTTGAEAASKPGPVAAVVSKAVPTVPCDNSGVKPDPVSDHASLSSASCNKIRPITINDDDDDELGLLMEVESEAEHDSLIIDLDEDDLDLNENGSQQSPASDFVRELSPSPAVLKNLPEGPKGILRKKLTESVTKVKTSSTACSSPSSVSLSGASLLSSLSSSSSSSSSSTAALSSAPCVMIDVRSLSGTEHDWQEGASTQQAAQSQLQPHSSPVGDAVVELPSPPPYVFHEFRTPAAPSAEPAERVSPSSAPVSSAAGSGSNRGHMDRSSEEEQGLDVAAVNLVNKYSQQIVGNAQQQLAQMCRELLAAAPKESENEQRLQEVREQLQWTHEQQLAEVQHNFKMTICEMKACWEAEKSKALSDLKKKLQKEKEESVADTKKKQWCASCWKEALYYCCWNTSYCSYACQQRHWTIHQNDCRQAIDAVSTAADVATTAEATILTTAVTTKTAEPDLKSLLGKGGTNSAEKDERIQAQKFNLVNPHTGQTIGVQAEDAWRARVSMPPQAIGQNIHFLPPQQPPSAQPLQQLQYLHSLGPAAQATFQTNSQVQLLTQRPTLNTVLPTGAVVPGNTMVFPILRTSQPGTLPGTQNVMLSRSMHYQPMWKNC